MSDIYDQHRAAFANVSAYIVMKDGDRVATVAFKFPKDGAGRLYCYFHILGGRMARAYASGGGYDKRSAAAESALHSIKVTEYRPDDMSIVTEMKDALSKMKGYSWERSLEIAGFTVLQAV